MPTTKKILKAVLPMSLLVIVLQLGFTPWLLAEASVEEVATQVMELEKDKSYSVRVLYDPEATLSWFLEITTEAEEKIMLNLPFRSGQTADVTLQAARFISPDKQQIFIAVTEYRGGVSMSCCVVDVQDQYAQIIFNNDWLGPLINFQATYLAGYRIHMVLPDFLDEYRIFLQNNEVKETFILMSIYDEQGELKKQPEAVIGAVPESAALAGPNEEGICGLSLAYSITGQSKLDIWGEYTFELRYQDKDWYVHGKPHFTPEAGFEAKSLRGLQTPKVQIMANTQGFRHVPIP